MERMRARRAEQEQPGLSVEEMEKEEVDGVERTASEDVEPLPKRP
jgi:hypothetical protein